MPNRSKRPAAPSRSGKTRRSLPGDPDPRTLQHRMIRVDQAGEFGAKEIYKGQLAILAGTRSESAIREMAAAEDKHLEFFNRLTVENRVRPTVLTPVWRVAGFALGAGTALLGEKAAMACTAAVEEVIEEHYQKQADLLDEESELKAAIEKFKNEEAHHRETALAHGAEETPGYRVLNGGIKAGTRLAIWLSERI